MHEEIPAEETRIKFSARDCLSLAFLIGLSLIATSAYVSSEKTLYWSDYSLHFFIWQHSVDFFKSSPLTWLVWLLSADAEVCAYYAVANMPFGLIFGSNRLIFVESLVVAYAWPFFILSSLVVANLFTTSRKIAFWVCLSLFVLNPLSWVIPWRGYPDFAAAAVFMGAWLLYLQDPVLARRNAAVLGILLGLTPLLRRHFAYPASAAFVSMFAYSTLLLKNEKDSQAQDKAQDKAQDRWIRVLSSSSFRSLFISYAIAALYAVGIAVVLAFGYCNALLNFNYEHLFISFRMDWLHMIKYFASTFGLTFLAVSIIGWYLALTRRLVPIGLAQLVLGYSLLIASIWFIAVRHVGVHYIVHFGWTLAAGFTALVVTLLKQARARRSAVVALAAIYTYMIINLVQGLGVYSPSFVKPTRWEMYALGDVGNWTSLFFSASNPPQTRSDLGEIYKLCIFLAQNLGAGNHVCVASSSPLFNDEILFYGTVSLLNDKEQKMMPKLVKLPQIDHRDDLPFHAMAQADAFIVAEPFQYHLEPEHQTVLRFVVDSFRDGVGLARDFQPIEKFRLDGGVVLTVFKRVAPASAATILDSLKAFQPYMRLPNSMINKWLIWKGADDVNVQFQAKLRRYQPVFQIQPRGKPGILRFLYLDELNENLTVSGGFEGAMPPAVSLRVLKIDRAGSEKIVKEFDLSPARMTFETEVAPEEGTLCCVDIDMAESGEPAESGKEATGAQLSLRLSSAPAGSSSR